MGQTALNRTIVAILTNKSGGALAFGDVVVLDNTNVDGFTTTTTAGLSARGLGVIIEPNGIANDASGLVATGGYAGKVNLNTAATIGQFIRSHTVAGQGTPHDAPQIEGDFGVALDASATPRAILFGGPNPPVAAAAASGLVFIEEQTPSGVAAITFSALGAHRHLRIVYSARGDQAAQSTLLSLTFNGDTGNNYDGQRSSFRGSGTFADQVAQASAFIGIITAASGPADYAGGGEIVVPDYLGTTFHKTAVAQAGAVLAQSTGNIDTRLFSAFWRDVAAISSITLTLASGNFVAGSKFTLYGMS